MVKQTTIGKNNIKIMISSHKYYKKIILTSNLIFISKLVLKTFFMLQRYNINLEKT